MAITPRTPAVTEGGSAVQTLTGALPSDIQTGDLVFAFYCGIGTLQTITEPSAPWTRVVLPANVASVNNIVAGLYYCWNTSALPATGPVMTTTVPGNRATWLVEAFGGVDISQPFDVSPPVLFGGTTSPDAVATTVAGPLITTATANALLLSFLAGAWSNSTGATFTLPGTMSQLASWSDPVSNAATTGRAAVIASETLAIPGDVTRTWTYTPNAANTGAESVTIALRPAGAAPVASLAAGGTFDPDLNRLAWF